MHGWMDVLIYIYGCTFIAIIFTSTYIFRTSSIKYIYNNCLDNNLQTHCI